MGKKKRSWFSFVRKLFIPHTKSKVEKCQKTRTWRWIFGGVKIKQYPEIGCRQMRLCEATEEQRKQVVAVAIATAAAAEAAVAAANAAAEVVKLTNSTRVFSRNFQLLAAIKIQCSFRRHLARKALSAMRGLVKLQAVIRGENMRRRINITKLKTMNNLLEKSPSRIHRIRVPLNDKEWIQSLAHNTFMESQESNIHDRNKSWDFSIASKEDMETLWIRKEEAFTKRERMKKYSYSHRECKNDEYNHGLNQFDSNSIQRTESRRRKNTTFSSDYLSGDGNNNNNKIRQITLNKAAAAAANKHDSTTESSNSPFALRRRSFSHTKQESIGDNDISLLNSPVFPTYMAATESAKAKFRSTSMPKQRLVLSDSFSSQHSPFKSKLSYLSSINGDMNSCCRNTGIFKF